MVPCKSFPSNIYLIGYCRYSRVVMLIGFVSYPSEGKNSNFSFKKHIPVLSCQRAAIRNAFLIAFSGVTLCYTGVLIALFLFL